MKQTWGGAQESVGVGSQESQEGEGCMLVQEWGHIPSWGDTSRCSAVWPERMGRRWVRIHLVGSEDERIGRYWGDGGCRWNAGEGLESLG